MTITLRKRAEAGIGTLILFIALILVAAVAAGVLVSTATSLQSKALFTGSQAQTQVSSQAMAISLYGKDASSGNPRLLNMSFYKLKLAPGSDPISLNTAVLQVDTTRERANIVYDSAIECDDETAGPTGIFNDTDTFGVKFLTGNDNAYIERGDVIELCFAFPEDVGEGEFLRVSFVPSVGSPALVDVRTPDVMLTQQVQLFP